MDDNFNWVKAATEVEARAVSNAANATDFGIHNADTHENLTGLFHRVQYPPSIRYMTREGDETLEIVFKMPGILCSKMLPPFKRMPAEPSLARIRNMKQYVRVAGGDSAVMQRAVKNMDAIYEAFKQHVGPAKVHPFSMLPYEGHICVESHARYFMDRDLVPYEKNEPFLMGVDPHNVLRRVQPESFIHAQDNRVEYCVETVTEDGQTSFEPFQPGLFAVGDMVEMAFSFVGIPVRDNMYKVMLHLRGLTLLNSDLRKECQALFAATDSFNLNDFVVVPKRRRLYLNDAQVKNTREQVSPHELGTEDNTEGVGAGTHDDGGLHAEGKGVNEVVEKISLMDVDNK